MKALFNNILAVLSIIVLSHSTAFAAEDAHRRNKPISNAWELPPLVLDDIEGEKHSLYDWQGKVIMLNFWATWCRPCQVEIPDFIEYQKHYNDKGLQVIGVGLDEVEKLRNYVRTVGINYPILSFRVCL